MISILPAYSQVISLMIAESTLKNKNVQALISTWTSTVIRNN